MNNEESQVVEADDIIQEPEQAPVALPANQSKERTRSLVTKFAHRFGVEPVNMMNTLKATAFRSKEGISNEQMAALLIVADQYHLNPFTREIYAFPDKGGIVPVVGIDGWARIINEHDQMNGVNFAFEGEGDDMVCTCSIHRKDREYPTVVSEYMREVKRNTQPWQSHPRRMLRHKSLIQCARIAFGFVGIYDEDEAERITDADRPQTLPPAAGTHSLKGGAK